MKNSLMVGFAIVVTISLISTASATPIINDFSLNNIKNKFKMGSSVCIVDSIFLQHLFIPRNLTLLEIIIILIFYIVMPIVTVITALTGNILIPAITMILMFILAVLDYWQQGKKIFPQS